MESTRDVAGGRIVAVKAIDHRVALPVEGPANTLRRDHQAASLELIADIDPNNAVARFQIGEQQFILRQGEWSGWVRIRFPLIRGLAGAAGMFRVYARRLQPGIQIYISPLNIDPFDPALPISNPAEYSRDLAARIGPFYTQGIEEDTSAMRQGALDLTEYLEQSRLVAREHRMLLQDCLRSFREGLLFFYLSEIDQNSHMLWGRHNEELLRTYQSVDEAVGSVIDQAGGATIIVMSDHGFATFDRAVNLNTWLRREGYLNLDNTQNVTRGESFAHVDWTRTQAYAMGLNGLYLNLAGRERIGIVPASARDTLRTELSRRLLDFRDSENGRTVIADMSETAHTTSSFAPDLIVGYAAGYRASWETALGFVPPEVIETNTDAWIGDHCISAAAVPGVLLGNRAPRISNPRLKDLTVTILNEFGVPPAEGMNGRPVY
jgi:predicted AlkP superfamily phosphohydrolase/phosphomutase